MSVVAVVMATYNGQKFIIDQLESIRMQSRAADYVFIRDDGSSDNTVYLITEYIKSNKLDKRWSLVKNPKNIGWRQNFINLINDASAVADFIFLSDQDDIWMENKIEMMLRYGEEVPEIGVLVSDYVLFGQAGGAEKMRDIPSVSISDVLHVVNLDIENLVTKRDGSSFMINRRIVPRILDLYSNVDMDPNGLPQAHDLAVWLSSLLSGNLYHLSVPTIEHRIHNTSTWATEAKKINRASLLEVDANLINYYDLIARYINNNSSLGKEKFAQFLEEKISDLRIESQIVSANAPIVTLLSKSIRFSSFRRFVGTFVRVLNYGKRR